MLNKLSAIVPQLRGNRKGPKPRQSGEFISEARPGMFARSAPSRPPFAKRHLSGLEVGLAYCTGLFLLAVAVILTPYTGTVWREVPGFIVSYSTALLIINLLVAVLLISKSRIENDPSHIILAAAYLYAGLIIIPHLASFPGGLMAKSILGETGSAIWLWVFWHAGFAWLMILYGVLSRHKMAPLRIPPVLLSVLLLVVSLSFVAFDDVKNLPTILTGQHYFDGHTGFAIMATVFLSNVTALGVVAARLRSRQAEYLWLTVGLLGACVDIWLCLCGGQRFSLGWYCGRICGLTTSVVLFISVLYDVLKTYGSVTAANDVLDRMTLTDSLTQLGNRRMFDNVLQNEWRRCRRDGLPLSVVLFDVDEFKLYNDNYGHQAGDACLQKIADRLYEAAARAGDLASRYGGEEFALILPATDCAGSEYLARLVRLTVRDMAIPHCASEKQIITISAGVATLVPSDDFDATELLRLADLALYRAKAAGRDTVMIAGQGPAVL